MAHRRTPEGRPYRRLKARRRANATHCWICGNPIDNTLKFPHPMSYTVDHIHPVGHDGQRDDMTNTADAHLHCNQRRGKGRQLAQRNSRDW